MKLHNLLLLCLLGNVVVQTEVYSAAHVAPRSRLLYNAAMAERLMHARKSFDRKKKDAITSEQLLNLYTDTILNEPGAAIQLTKLIHPLLTDQQGNTISSIYNNVDASDLEDMINDGISKGGAVMLSPHILAEFIYTAEHNRNIRNIPIDGSPILLNTKRLLDTAVRYNLLNNPTYSSFRKDSNYQRALESLTIRLAQYDNNRRASWWRRLFSRKS